MDYVEKISAEAYSGKEIAGLLKKMMMMMVMKNMMTRKIVKNILAWQTGGRYERAIAYV